MNSHSHLKWQLFICTAMLALALLGLMVLYFYPQGYWTYSRIMALLYAALSVGLFLVSNRQHVFATFWHQMLHWLGLLLAILVLMIYVRTGVISTLQAGLVTLLLLGFSIFLAGIYISPFLMLLGGILGVIAVVAAYIQAYLLIIIVPVILIAVGVFFIFMRHKQKVKSNDTLS